MPISRRVLLCLLLPALLTLGACTPPQATRTPPTAEPTRTPPPPLAGVSQPPAGKYLFVEVWTTVGGTGHLPQLMIDFPTYRYNRESGALESYTGGANLDLGAGDWGLAGRGSSRGGDAGGGAASQLESIRELPYSTTVRIFTGQVGEMGMEDTRSAPVVVEAVDGEGRLMATIDGERVLLAPGEAWSRTVEADVSTREGKGHYVVTSVVTNYGWLERSLLGGPSS
jgi:hypothetical protein